MKNERQKEKDDFEINYFSNCSHDCDCGYRLSDDGESGFGKYDRADRFGIKITHLLPPRTILGGGFLG